MKTAHMRKKDEDMAVSNKSVPGTSRHFDVHVLVTSSLQTSKSRTQNGSIHPYRHWTKFCRTKPGRADGQTDRWIDRRAGEQKGSEEGSEEGRKRKEEEGRRRMNRKEEEGRGRSKKNE